MLTTLIRPHHLINLRSKMSMSTSCVQQDCIFPMHILGGGSIGFLFAVAIQKSCGDVTMLLRKHHEPRLSVKPCERSSTAATKYLAPVQVCRPYEPQIITACDISAEIIGDAQDPIECLLLCTKANDAIHALSSIWNRLGRENAANAKVIILSNGALAIRDSIQTHFNDHQHVQIITATTTHGAYSKRVSSNDNSSGYCLVHAGDGLTYCTNNKFIDACQKVGWKGGSLSEFEMNMMLWKKLAANCVINPLTAIHGVKNGQLLSVVDIDRITTHILEEVSSIAILEMESFIQAEEDGKVQAHLQCLIREEFSVDSLKTFVTNVMTDTSDNISSMLQDVNAKRTTEVRFLNGYVARLGKEKYSIDCQWNKGMCNKVEDL
jgi:2-dehydropantoate 2-reductase